MFLNICWIKYNQSMKFGQLIEHPKRNIFAFKKSFILGDSKWSAAWFHYISIALKLAYNKNKLFKTIHYWPWDMLNFYFLDLRLGFYGLRIVSPAHFVHEFSTKMFLMLHLLTDQISFTGCLYLRYWAICVLILLVIHVMTSWISKLTLPF